MTIGQDGIGERLLVFVGAPIPPSTQIDPSFLGSQLKKMLKRASEWAKLHREAADAMSTTWSVFVKDWRAMLRAFKKDRSKPNPFAEPDPGNFACAGQIPD